MDEPIESTVYHDVFECLRLGICWYCQSHKSTSVLEGIPTCAACRKRRIALGKPGGGDG